MSEQDTTQLTPDAVAAYVHEMALALSRFAKANSLPELAYFLEMAAIAALDRPAIDSGCQLRTD